MKLSNLVKREIEYFIQECNFTEDELSYFQLKAKDKSNVQIATILNVSESKVSCLARAVKSKMEKVL